MKSNALIFWLGILFTFSGGMVVWLVFEGSRPEHTATTRREFSAPVNQEPLRYFTLMERSGEKFRSQSLDGEIWVASFFFANCPHQCTNQNLTIKKLAEHYQEQHLKFVSITCDPENDTPSRLAKYADRFGADEQQWLFLTGKESYIQQVGAEIFKVSVSPNTHSQKLMLINREGKVHGYFQWNDAGQIDLFHREVDKLLGDVPASSSVNSDIQSSKTVGN
ncbi:MAG: copper transporter [Planctomycetaceae bacterium]|nr:copper transporter [Planctomycetaceae bacterium]MBP62938.1 copper transporter [Planctomycetaceae bacterium]